MEAWKLRVNENDDTDIKIDIPASATSEGVGIVTIYGIPMGFTILPLAITPEMEVVLKHAIEHNKSCKQIWKALIKASPSVGTIIYRPNKPK